MSNNKSNKNSKLLIVMWFLLILIFLARKFHLTSFAILFSIAFFITLLLAINNRNKASMEQDNNKADKDHKQHQ